MDTNEAHRMIGEAMREHGLLATGWTWRWNNRKTAFGVCNHTARRLEFSLPLWKVNDRDRCMDNLLHEIAHALAGYSAGHGPVWRRTVVAIGGKAERCWSPTNTATPPSRWVGECPHCGATFQRHRRTEKMFRLICGKCSRDSRITRKHRIMWRENVAGIRQTA